MTPVAVDNEPAKRNLENALRSLDNMQKLVTMLATEKRKKAVAVNVGMSADGMFTVYVTADDRVDEEKLGRAALESFTWASMEGLSAAAVRAVLAQQWQLAVMTWCGHNFDDVVFDLRSAEEIVRAL